MSLRRILKIAVILGVVLAFSIGYTAITVTVNINSPSDGSTYNYDDPVPVELSVTVNNNPYATLEVVYAQVSIDGNNYSVPLSSSGGGSYTGRIYVVGLDAGDHTLNASAYAKNSNNEEGNATAGPVHFTVSPPPPPPNLPPSATSAWIEVVDSVDVNGTLFTSSANPRIRWGGFYDPDGNLDHLVLGIKYPDNTTVETTVNLDQNQPFALPLTLSPTGSGQNRIYMYAVDASGETSSQVSVTVTYDPFVPTITYVSPTGTTDEVQPKLVFSVNDNPPSGFSAQSGVDPRTIVVEINGTSYTPSSNPDTDVSAVRVSGFSSSGGNITFDLKVAGITLEPGNVVVNATVKDKVGNESARASGNFTIERGAYTGSGMITEPTAGVYLMNNQPVIRGYLTDSDEVQQESVEMIVNGITFTYDNPSMTVSPTGVRVDVELNVPLPLADGTVDVVLRGKDKYDNDVGPVTTQFYIDTTPPEVRYTGVYPSGSTVSLAEFSGTSFEVTDAGSGVDDIGIYVENAEASFEGTLENMITGGGATALTTPFGTFIYSPSTHILTYNPSGLNPGTLKIKVIARDAATDGTNPVGNLMDEPVEWEITLTGGEGPTVVDIKPARDTYVSDKRTTIEVVLYDENGVATDSVKFRVNGLVFDSHSGLISYNQITEQTLEVIFSGYGFDLRESINDVAVYAEDKGGAAMSPEWYAWSFGVDVQAPTVENFKPRGVVSATPVITADIIDKPDTENSGVSPTVEVQLTDSRGTVYNWVANRDAGVTFNPVTSVLRVDIAATSIGAAGLPVGTTTIQIKVADNALDWQGNSAPNRATYEFEFVVGSATAPVLVAVEPADGSATSEWSYMKFWIKDEDPIDRDSFNLDINGFILNGASTRFTFDGPRQMTLPNGETATATVITLTEIPDFLKQEGRVSAIITGLQDIYGNATTEYRWSFYYDLHGPTASEGEPSGDWIFSQTPQIKFKLEDNLSGVNPASVEIYVDVETSNGTTRMIYKPGDGATNYDGTWVTINPTSELFDTATAHVVVKLPSTTADMAENGLFYDKTADSPASSTYEFDFYALNPASVAVNLTSPAQTALVNPYNDDFKFEWSNLMVADGNKELPSEAVDHYVVQVSRDEAFGDLVVSQTVDGTSWHPEGASFVTNAEYHWRVQAYDKFGNAIASTSRRFTVDTEKPRKPTVAGVVDFYNHATPYVNLDPLGEATYVKNKTIKILMTTVNTTESITFKVYYEDGTLAGEKKYDVFKPTTEVYITLPDEEGTYKLYAVAVDAAGNQSDPTPTFKIIYDKTPPVFENLTITDNSPGSNGYITSGLVKVTIDFSDASGLLPLSEYAKSDLATPEIYVDPAQSAGTGAVKLQNVTIGKNTITGEFYVPFGHPDEWDGLADVIIKGVRDKARNGFDTDTYYVRGAFEINTAPGFDVKVYLNPIDERYAMINIETTERLSANPQVWIESANGSYTLDVKQISEYVYLASVKADVSTTSIRISGTDMLGNTGFWPAPDNSAQILIGSRVFIGKGTVIEGKDSAKVAIVKNVPVSGYSLDEARVCLPEELKVVAEAFQAAKTAPVRSSVALYDLTESRWIGSVGKLERNHVYVPVEDKTSPRVSFVRSITRGTTDIASSNAGLNAQDTLTVQGVLPAVEFYVEDFGAGVRLDEIKAEIGNVPMLVEVADGVSGGEVVNSAKIMVRAPYVLKPQVATISVEVPDQAGNVTRVYVRAVVLPVSLNVRPAPNPVTSSPAHFKVWANQNIDSADIGSIRVSIYDTAGELVKTIDVVPQNIGDDLASALDITWDLTTDDLDYVRRGIYLVKVKVVLGQQTAKGYTKVFVAK